MLKHRVIPVLFLRHGFLVRSESFSIFQNLGNPVAQVDRYAAWDVDELIYIDITPDDHYDYMREDMGKENPNNPLDILSMVAKSSFMPLTFGGKIRTLEDIRERMKRGADKVTLNTAVIEDPDFLQSAARKFGAQALVISVDVKLVDGEYRVFSHLGKRDTGMDPCDWVAQVEQRGGGEIFLNAIDRDGAGTGLDLELTRKVVAATTIPVITCGGIGDFIQFKKGLREGGADAVAAGNIFNFKEFSYQLAKRDLKKHGLNVR